MRSSPGHPGHRTVRTKTACLERRTLHADRSGHCNSWLGLAPADDVDEGLLPLLLSDGNSNTLTEEIVKALALLVGASK